MKKYIGIICVVLGMSACGPYRVSENKNPIQEREKVVLLDVVLKNLNFVKQRSTQMSDGRMKVEVTMENERNKDIWTDVQVVFKDADGGEVELSLIHI